MPLERTECKGVVPAKRTEEYLLPLLEENEIKQRRIEILEHNVEALTQALLQAAKQRFGASSEKTPNSDEQLYLFEEKPEWNTPGQ